MKHTMDTINPGGEVNSDNLTPWAGEFDVPATDPKQKPEVEPDQLPKEDPGQPGIDPGEDDDDDDDDPFTGTEIGDDPDEIEKKTTIF